jgi:hypothetical protein
VSGSPSLTLATTLPHGRIVVLDDRIVLFANPEDAAEYIGFNLQPVR